MKQILYVMQFKGRATPKPEQAGAITARTNARSCTFTSVVDSNGLTGSLPSLEKGQASFESEVTLTGETSFKETGVIRFGDSNHSVRFSTIGEGFLGKSPDPALQHGSIMWRVDGGEGQFAGASGIITSNFTLSASGEVSDNHSGVIFVQ